MSQSLVSILIPFKNTESFIAKCMTSILTQTYCQWEAIFVDDHSDDLSSAIVEEYTRNDPRIKCYKNEGTGIIEALRTAFKNCTGEYITRMDSDDIMTPNRLDVMVNSLVKYGKGHLAVGQVNYFRADGVSDGYARYERWINQLTQTGSNYSEIYKECVIPSPCWMLYRDDFIACEGFEPNRYPEDYDLTFRFYRAGYKCIPCNEILLHWRDYDSRTSRTHEHYAINYFLDIKVYYFLELDYDSNRPLTVWGAGNKGKTVAKLLIKNQIPFYWICDNQKKIGKDIYGQKLLNFNYLQQLDSPQSIVTVANEDEQKTITEYFKIHKMSSMKDYFFFC
ncbi:glycosyltransferase family 2 protein [Winogradskyella sp.]|uniref:glycosyltransferase family 2 protein n=1 Tax=Winogradskyella sp. TaxID=1883156 RepID=UPI0026043EC7|nr:glycosyltransferase family 2 protein [Winogradskyella sp.]